MSTFLLPRRCFSRMNLLFFILTASEFYSARSAACQERAELAYHESFWWPSDRDQVLSIDPDLATFTQFPFPWN